MNEAISKFPSCYATNNSTIAFIYESRFFVTPYTRKAIKTLDQAGFTRTCFYVPFSNWDYPKERQAKWEYLRAQAQKSYMDDYHDDCEAWCNEHSIGVLPEKVLSRCFKMPRNGVPIKFHGVENTYYPIFNGTLLDAVAIAKIGRFCTNNGKVVFMYRDGETYVTAGYWILKYLREANYKEEGIFVPFSNGEEITDPKLAAMWENVRKKVCNVSNE